MLLCSLLSFVLLGLCYCDCFSILLFVSLLVLYWLMVGSCLCWILVCFNCGFGVVRIGV